MPDQEDIKPDQEQTSGPVEQPTPVVEESPVLEIDDSSSPLETPASETVAVNAQTGEGRQFFETPPTPGAPVIGDPVVSQEPETWQKHRVTIDKPVRKPGDKLNSVETLAMPSVPPAVMIKNLERAPEASLVDSKQGRAWGEAVNDGQDFVMVKDVFNETLAREDAEFTNKPKNNEVSIGPGFPQYKSLGSETIAGERAVMRLMSHLKLGRNFQALLPHSGIWMTFKPPGEMALLELNRQNIMDKVKLGRFTYGLAFSNITGIITERLAYFALEHLYDISMKMDEVENRKNLLDHISILDLPALLHGVVSAQYPNGYNYETACVHDPEKCNHVEQGVLSIADSIYFDFSSLTPWQKTFLTKRQSKQSTLAEVKRYQEEFKLTEKRRHTFTASTGESIHITLKVPSIAESIQATHAWVDSIDDVVTKSLSETDDPNVRIGMINNYGQSSSMRQYTQWIEKVDFGDSGDETNPNITDAETIEKLLNVLSSDDGLREEFFKKVVDFINQATVSVVGIPTYDCPSCGKSSKNVSETFKSIIPIDIIQVFFALLTRKLSRISRR